MFYGLNISENNEIKDVFQSKGFFHLGNTLHKSCLDAFSQRLRNNTYKILQMQQNL